MVKSVTQSRYCFTIFYRPWNYPSSHYQNGDTCIQHEIKEFTTLADVAGSENGFRCFGRGSVSDGDSIPPALEHRGQI